MDAKVTTSEAIFVEAKRRPLPSTHSYEPLKCFKYTLPKTPGNYLQKSLDKAIHYTDEEANILRGYPGPGNREPRINLAIYKHRKEKEWKI